MKSGILILFVLSLVFGMAFVTTHVLSDVDDDEETTRGEENGIVQMSEHQPHIFFVGDIMMGRDVETHMEKYGPSYPFAGMQNMISNADIAIGNFEGTVSEIHEHTPLFAMNFSIKSTYLAYLRTVGFDILSLANNHSLDFGLSSLTYTRDLCMSYSLVCAGSPNSLNMYSTHVVNVDEKSIGIIFLHTLIAEPDTVDLKRVLAELSEYSDIQVAYIHWGDEYKLSHNTQQEKFAHVLIDEGVDVIVGHHPHVAQDIELYKDKPIFYSLGNFVFDQYFSDDVQEMYGITMNLNDESIVYTIVPMSSALARNQPHPMSPVLQKPFFERLFGTIKNESGVSQETGIITVPY